MQEILDATNESVKMFLFFLAGKLLYCMNQRIAVIYSWLLRKVLTSTLFETTATAKTRNWCNNNSLYKQSILMTGFHIFQLKTYIMQIRQKCNIAKLVLHMPYLVTIIKKSHLHSGLRGWKNENWETELEASAWSFIPN